MRMDKLTTKFQQALADAQSIAVGQDNQFIEPVTCGSLSVSRRTAKKERRSIRPRTLNGLPARRNPVREAAPNRVHCRLR
jgi:ATP-dependent Clp protease ATP-binding subunit ClpB